MKLRLLKCRFLWLAFSRDPRDFVEHPEEETPEPEPPRRPKPYVMSGSLEVSLWEKYFFSFMQDLHSVGESPQRIEDHITKAAAAADHAILLMKARVHGMPPGDD